MYIDILELRVHNDWRGERSSLDPLRGVVKIRENNAWEGRVRVRECWGGGGGGGGGVGRRDDD